MFRNYNPFLFGIRTTQCSLATMMSRVASLCDGSIKVLDAIGEDHIGAVTLKFVGTAIARVTCSNHAANTNFVSNSELLYLASHFCHYTHNLMPALSNSVHMISIWDNKKNQKLSKIHSLISSNRHIGNSIQLGMFWYVELKDLREVQYKC